MSASEAITTTSERALFIGCRCASRLMAPATQMSPKTINRTWWTIRLCPPRHNQAGDNDIGNGQRQKKLPPESHKLVIAESRQRAANPYIEEDKKENFGRKVHNRQQCLPDGRKKCKRRTMPSAKEQQAGQAGNRKHVHVFGHEEHGKFHRAVLGVIAGYKFGFGFRHIERNAVGFSVCCQQINKEADDLGKDEPVRNVRVMPAENPVAALAEYDLTQAQAPGEQQNADKGEAKGKLVADHLGTGTQRTE